MTNPNDPIHPCTRSEMDHIRAPEKSVWHSGLTKREYFAAMAMQGILAQQEVKGLPEDLAKSACVCADALIKELSK